MARKTEELTLTLNDETEVVVHVTQLMGVDAPGGLARTGRLFGRTMSNADDEEIAQAMLCADFNDADFAWLRDKFLSCSQRIWVAEAVGGTTTKATRLTVDTFDGELQAQMKWLWFCIRLNFANFLVASRSSASRAPRRTGESSNSPNGSTGSSGASSAPETASEPA